MVVFEVLITFSKDFYSAVHDKLHVVFLSSKRQDIIQKWLFLSLNPNFLAFGRTPMLH